MTALDKLRNRILLSTQIKKVIGNRILISSILLIFIIISLTFFDIFDSVQTLKSRIDEEIKPLEYFIISQSLIDNLQAIHIKLNNFNSSNTYGHTVEWVSSGTIGFNRIHWKPPFSWVYYYKLGNIEGYKYGYLKVTGSFLDDRSLIKTAIMRLSTLLIFTLILLIFIFPLGRKIPEKLFINPINRFLDMIDNPDENKRQEMQESLPIELVHLEEKILSLLEKTKEHERNENLIKIGEISAQVAHDIRSPLTALNVSLEQLPQIPEAQRIVLRNALVRINDIANNLLNQYRNKEDEILELKSWLVVPLIEAIASEKRLQLENSRIKLLTNFTKDSYFSFVKISTHEIKRALSNLINNAIESLQLNEGVVSVSLSTKRESVVLKITDTGCGIPEEEVSTIFEAKKTTKESGSGLGLAYVKRVVDRMNGKINITSMLGRGTTVELIFPRVQPPVWFISEIVIERKKHIIILDDDESIHKAWETRLENFSSDLNITHFYTGDDFIAWYDEYKDQSILVFSDYELIGEKKSGLDILEEVGVGKSGILITSYYENVDIIERCVNNNIRLMPKELVAYIPIRAEKYSQEISGEKKYDLILIDNDQNLCATWELAALSSDKNLGVFNEISQLESILDTIALDTALYIDSDLGDGVKGEDFAKELYKKGYNNIYLTTGHDSSHFPYMHWIKQIIGKEPPFDR